MKILLSSLNFQIIPLMEGNEERIVRAFTTLGLKGQQKELGHNGASRELVTLEEGGHLREFVLWNSEEEGPEGTLT